MKAYKQFLKVFTKDFHLLVPFFSASLRSRSNICSNARSLTNFDKVILHSLANHGSDHLLSIDILRVRTKVIVIDEE